MSGKQITTSKRLISNSIFNIVGYIANSVILFFLVPFFIDKLGKPAYGVWALVGAVFYYSAMLQMGLASAVTRYIPTFLGKGDREGVRRVMSTSTAFFSVVGLVLVIVTLVVRANLTSWFEIPPHLADDAKTVILVVGLSWAVVISLHSSISALLGVQRFDIVRLLAFGVTVARAVILVVLLSRGYGLVTMGLVFGGTLLVRRALEMMFATRLLGRGLISIKAINLSLFRDMFAYGINTMLYGLGNMILTRASLIIIGIFMTAEDVADYYVVGVVLLAMLTGLVQSFTLATHPAVADLDTHDQQAKVREVASLTQKYSLIMLIPGISFLIIMGRDVLQVWLGPGFEQLSIILTILAVGQFLRLAQHSNFSVLAGKGEHKIFGQLALVMSVSVIVLSVISVKILNMGLIGIALSNMVPMVIISGLILPIHCLGRLNISIRDNIRQVWWPALLGCTCTVILIGVWEYLYPPSSWLQIGMVIVAATVLTAVNVWFLSLTSMEKSRLLRVFNRTR